MGDLATKWWSSLVNPCIDWANDPTSIMIAQAAKDHEADLERRNPEVFCTAWRNNPDYYLIGPTGPGDTLVFHSSTPEGSRPPHQLTLMEAWSHKT